MASKRDAETEIRVRVAMAELLAGNIPEGHKCDITSLCRLASVSRATLYRTYPHLKAEFDQRRMNTIEAGYQPDPRLAQIDRLKVEVTELRARLSRVNSEISDLEAWKSVALSRLAAQHDEITALRREVEGTLHGKIHTLPAR